MGAAGELRLSLACPAQIRWFWPSPVRGSSEPGRVMRLGSAVWLFSLPVGIALAMSGGRGLRCASSRA